MDGLFVVRGPKACIDKLSGSEPVTCIEWAAHAQRQRRHIDELVGWHFFAFLHQLGSFAAFSLNRPSCLAILRRTGYRKE
jgi:hypothetical protein